MSSRRGLALSSMMVPVAAAASMTAGMIHRVAFAREQQAAGEVAEHGDVRIRDGADDALGHLGLREVEDGVHGGDDVIELREDFVGKVERAVVQDVALDAGEEAEVAVEGGVQLANFVELREELLGAGGRAPGRSCLE